MKKEEVEVMENIEKIEKNQSLLLKAPSSPQQELFRVFAHRHLLGLKMIHRQLEEVLQYVPGSFGRFALYMQYI